MPAVPLCPQGLATTEDLQNVVSPVFLHRHLLLLVTKWRPGATCVVAARFGLRLSRATIRAGAGGGKVPTSGPKLKGHQKPQDSRQMRF